MIKRRTRNTHKRGWTFPEKIFHSNGTIERQGIQHIQKLVIFNPIWKPKPPTEKNVLNEIFSFSIIATTSHLEFVSNSPSTIKNSTDNLSGERIFSHTPNVVNRTFPSSIHGFIFPLKRKSSPPTSAWFTPISKSQKSRKEQAKKQDYQRSHRRQRPPGEPASDRITGSPGFKSRMGHSQQGRSAVARVNSPHRPASEGGIRTQAGEQP